MGEIWGAPSWPRFLIFYSRVSEKVPANTQPQLNRKISLHWIWREETPPKGQFKNTLQEPVSAASWNIAFKNIKKKKKNYKSM